MLGKLLSLLKWASVSGVLVVCGGCAETNLTQPPNIALVHIGSQRNPDHLEVGDHAGLFAPYAVLAARAYEPIDNFGQLIPANATKFATAEGENVDRQASQWLARWRYITGEQGPICKDKNDQSCSQIKGLQYNIWARKDCSEVAIVFRGTDAGSLGDWLTNFHGLLRLLPLHDQYDQIRFAMDRIVGRAQAACKGHSPRIVAVGHSLGGGLAQHAAYVSPVIKHVYAFDPSFVTGYYDSAIKQNAGQGDTFERIYEHGEILAYFRYFIRRLRPESACDPMMRGFRVDLIHGQPIFQHNMDKLASAFVRAAGTPYDPRRAIALRGPKPGEFPQCDSKPASPQVASR